HYVCVGDRRPLAAALITNRPRISAGTLRSDTQYVARIYPRDTSTACADLYQIDDRGSDWVTASARLPRTRASLRPDFVFLRDLRASIQDETGFGSGSAHVERHDVFASQIAGDKVCRDYSRCWPGFDHV